MLPRESLHNAQILATRWFTRSYVSQSTRKMEKIDQSKSGGVLGTRMHRVSNFDRRVLVWVKRYPSIAEVPQDITIECLLTARSKARVKGCNYMIIATIIGCIGSVLLGKRQAAQGETLFKQRQDWYAEVLKEKDK